MQRRINRLRAMGRYQQLAWAKILAISSFGTIILSCTNATLVKAETKQSDFTLRAEGNQTFETLVQQAESLASKSIKQGFAGKSSVTEVSVMIMGERNGQEVPLMFSRVSRYSWRTEPKIKRWSIYFDRAAILLGFVKPQSPQNRLTSSSAKPSRIKKSPVFRDD